MGKSFMSMYEVNGENLMIVDVLSVVFSHAGKSVDRFINTIESIGRSYNAQLILMCCDRRDDQGNKSTFRNGIYPEYKANRDERIKNQSPEQKEEMEGKLATYLKLLEMDREGIQMGVIPKKWIRFKGVEADDLGAYFSKNLRDCFREVWLVSVDGDWDQLLEDNVYRFSVQTRKEYTTDELYDVHGATTVDEFAAITAIKGDPKDNVIGAKGVGPTRARAALSMFGGDFFSLVENLPLEGKTKYIQSINGLGKDKLLTNFELVALRDFHEDALAASNCLEDCAEIAEEIRGTYGV